MLFEEISAWEHEKIAGEPFAKTGAQGPSSKHIGILDYTATVVIDGRLQWAADGFYFVIQTFIACIH